MISECISALQTSPGLLYPAQFPDESHECARWSPRTCPRPLACAPHIVSVPESSFLNQLSFRKSSSKPGPSHHALALLLKQPALSE